MTDENSLTRDAILDISKTFDPASGIAVVCAYENRNLLSRIDMRGKDVLELGCGCLPASFGIKDEQMPAHYLATDSEADLIAAARKVDPRLQFRVVSALAPDADGKSYDVLIMRGVLHHLPEPSQALAALKPLLKPKGVLLLYEPNLSCLPANFAKWILLRFFKVVLEASPYGQLSQPKIRRAVKEAGMKISDEWYTSLLAFPLTGDYGRKPILPDSQFLFRIIIWFDRILSHLLHVSLWIAKYFHWRVIFEIQRDDQ